MKIPVTGQSIADAKQRDSKMCMVADAIRHKLKAQFISVDIQSIKFSVPKKDTRFVYMTPPDVQRAIIAFDQGKPVKPFTFSLTKPITVEPMMHVPSATIEQQKRARKKYDKARKAGTLAPKATRHHAPREREYGVRLLSA